MNSTTKLPIWYWIISILALLYFLLDSMMFYSRAFMLEEYLEKMPEQHALFSSMPAWVNYVFGLEVFGGLMGSLALLSRKKWAFILFGISLMGVLAQSSYLWFASDAAAVLGNAAIVMPIVAIVIGVVMIMISRSAISKEWIT
jgi:hypothetical protein